ncbi:metal-dependent hydrolase family protein [Sphingomonas colocasiae]|uniref:Amidohydrolase family protein n=1 Tax=Sphingomonas colocasiae TaxID=1848973 RepID=A0ABS7PS19_9SPHN|nr:amidohydrolase family protein [Sphingomonas colocasiae]MBY8824138.1 amidohydrolase family protein [Sphingomonas colocasiae]
MTKTVFTNCRIFDGIDVITQSGTVVIEGGRIARVDIAGGGETDGDVIDAAGMTLMPGLIDAHVHVYAYEANLIRNDSASMVARTLHAEQVMQSALMRGFTALRDAGGADRDLADALDARMFDGPRLFYSGLALSQTGGHGDFRVPGLRLCGCGYTGAISTIADGVDEVRKAAREQLRWGASQVKIMASGGAASPSDPIWMVQYTEAEIAAAVEEAARWGTYVMAHAYTPEAISRCVRLGVRTIEHGNHIDAASAADVAAHGAFVVPTLSTYNSLIANGAAHGWSEDLLDKIRTVQAAGLESLRILRDAGVATGFGTDLLGAMHVDQCDEFAIRAQVLDPIDILRSATSVNAKILQKGDMLGRIKVGATADLILVDGDPTTDLSVFTADGANIRTVMIEGAVRKPFAAR